MKIPPLLKSLILSKDPSFVFSSNPNLDEHVEVGPFTVSEIEKIYYELMENDFYDEEYNLTSWKPEPYELMANILCDVFKLEDNKSPDIIDVGCGVGYLVESFRRRGIEAGGIEFSKQIYNRISEETKKYVHFFNEHNFYNKFKFSGLKLVLSLEVYEHLPLSLIQKNLEKLFKEHTGWVFLTIPSIGIDPYNGRSIFNESSPFRIDDMNQNKLFSYLAMLNGTPGGGHITLASIRWWTDFFFINNWVRDFLMESKLEDYNHILKAYRWCPYILKKLNSEDVTFSGGWLPYLKSNDEYGNHGQFNLSNAELLFAYNRNKKLFLSFEIFDPNTNQFPLYITLRFWTLSICSENAKIDYTLLQTRTETIEYNKSNSYELILELNLRIEDSVKIKVEVNTPMFWKHDSKKDKDISVGYIFKHCTLI